MKLEKTIYLDHNATTPVAPELLADLPKWGVAWGNPSSVHLAGRKPKQLVRQARKSISKVLAVHPLEIIFTSGGSEANNLAIQSVFTEEWWRKKNKKAEFITSNVEHPSVAKVFDFIESFGAKVHRISLNTKGEFDLDQFKNCLNENTVLVSIMYANNETGACLPIDQIVPMAHSFGALVHTDAVQALGKEDIQLKNLNVDYCSFSAHKVYSLKGAGCLYVKTGVPLGSLIMGGAQERSRRAGTENTLAIASFGQAVENIGDLHTRNNHIRKLRDQMEKLISENIEDCFILSQEAQRLSNTSNVVFSGIDGESLLMNLDLVGIYVSTGAACSSGSSEPSPVLMAMGLNREQAQGSLRLSLGWNTTEFEIITFVKELSRIVQRLRQLKQESVS